LFMVLLVHAAYEVFGSFAASVDMFFVVSGFLIVTLLMEEHRSTGDINLRQFYLRRALRLFPALYTTIVITLVALLAVGGEEMRRKAIEDAWAAGLYVYHVVHPVHQEVVNGGAPEIRPLVHLWSLSVEEHFYLIVAVGMMLVFRRRWLVPMAWTFVAIWVAIGVARFPRGTPDPGSPGTSARTRCCWEWWPRSSTPGCCQLNSLIGIVCCCAVPGLLPP